jgi:acetolactate synthase-1/2/3 large subunit
VVAAHLPANAIVSAEGATLGFPFNGLASQAERHSTIVLTGGAIGQGLPSAFGASVAAPDRKVVALQSDGSALFTIQALWSMAREGSDVVIILASNQRYNILINEMARNGYELTSPPVRDLLSLGRPAVDWQALSASFGVPSDRVDSVSTLRRAYQAALTERGPRLIEVVLP